MRRQERKTTKCNECNGDQLYVGGRRQGNDSFPEKKAIRTQMQGVRELEVQKILKSVASSRRNQDLPDVPVIKPIGTVICPK
jgi:hypothetical protein